MESRVSALCSFHMWNLNKESPKFSRADFFSEAHGRTNTENSAEDLFLKPDLFLNFFLGGPMAKTSCSQCRGPAFDPWSGN